MKNKKNNFRERREKFLEIVILAGILLVFNLIFSTIYFGVLKIPNFKTESEIISGEREKINLIYDKENALSIRDFVEIDYFFLSEDFIVLRNKNKKCEGMVVAIDYNQAFSIQQGNESKVSFRPLSHDTIRDILEQYEIEVLMVKITELKNGAYFGRLILSDGNKIVNLDIRPSDGVAIAVRTQAPIYLSKFLLEEFGENIC